MGKVILITSREFKDQKVREKRLDFSKDYFRLFLFLGNKQNGISYHLRKLEDFRKWFEKEEDEEGEEGIKLLSKENDFPCEEALLKTLDERIEGVIDALSPTSKDFIEGMEKHIRNHKKSEGDSFHAGVFKIGDAPANHIKMYLAEEYPFLEEDGGMFSEERATYLDALIGMVIEDVKKRTPMEGQQGQQDQSSNSNNMSGNKAEAGAQQSVINAKAAADAAKEVETEEVKGDDQIDKMLILSHDADWGKTFETAIFNLDFVDEEIMPKLCCIKNKVKVYCFQHDDLGSKYFKTIKENIKNPNDLFNAFDKLSNNIDNFLDYLNDGEVSKLNSVDFTKAYLPDVPCPKEFELNEL